MAEPLSPADQAMLVLAAYGSFTGGIDAVMLSERRGLAAAIRALVDQTVPACSALSESGTKQLLVRHAQLAIAAELEGGATTPTTPQEAQ